MTFGLPLPPLDPPVLKAGDRMRFNTELLQEIHDTPYHASQLLIVESIERDADGTVTVWLQDAAKAAERTSDGSD